MADQAKNVASEGSSKWIAMSEEQKKTTFDSLPADQKKGKTYMEWLSEGYHHQYENWMPWIEDKYLSWFTKDNKASYATKDGLDKTKVTGIEQVDTLQDGVNNLVGGQVGKGGLLQPIGDMASSEGLNRAERGGKDDKGGYLPSDPTGVTSGVADGASSVGSTVTGGAKGASGYVSSLWGGNKESAEKK